MTRIFSSTQSALLSCVVVFSLPTDVLCKPPLCPSTESKSSSPAMNAIPTIRLSNGVEMPAIAAGMCFRDTVKTDTSPSSIPSNPNFFGFLPEKAYSSFFNALDVGYNHVDTALVYRTQKAIGYVLGNKFMSGEITREDIFITSKIMHGDMPGLTRYGTTLPLDSMEPEDVTIKIEEHFERVLEEVGVGYVDLMLLHWPAIMNSNDKRNAARRLAAWKVLEKMLLRGLTRSIGVSNFNEHHIDQLMKDGAHILPMVNQIEASVYKQYDTIREYCKKQGIAIMAYSPLGLGMKSLLNDPILTSIAKSNDVAVSQVALRYLIQRGYAVLPSSTSRERLKLNLDIFSFELNNEEMRLLKDLSKKDEGIGLPSPYNMA